MKQTVQDHASQEIPEPNLQAAIIIIIIIIIIVVVVVIIIINIIIEIRR